MKLLQRFRSSLFNQLLALVLTSLIAFIGVNLGIIFLLPPPPPEFYRVSEIAATLRAQGESVRAHNGRVLHAEVLKAPRAPAEEHPGRITYFLSHDIGSHLGVSEDRVRLVLLGGGPATQFGRNLRLMRDQLGPEMRDGRGPPGRDRMGPWSQEGRGPPMLDPHGTPMRESREAPARERFAPSGDHIVIVPFEASLKLPDGRWSVLRANEGGLLSRWQRGVLLGLGLSLAIAAPIAFLFARHLAGQITAFALAVERLGRDPHAAPMSLTGPREVERAVDAFNEMQDRLRRYVVDRTEMVAAVAHDLRTPLTRLRFRIEVVPEPQRTRMIDDIEQMETMIAGVMAFVRDSTQRAKRERLELTSLVECVAEEMVETGHDVQVATGAPVVVEADPVALRRLVTNLLDNAVKFGGRARARVFVESGSAFVEVDDDGPGIPATELDRVFEPFYRAERSRSRETGGSGLGLAVVQSVARSHGGEAALVNLPGGGLRARARLPLEPGAPESSPAQAAPLSTPHLAATV